MRGPGSLSVTPRTQRPAAVATLAGGLLFVLWSAAIASDGRPDRLVVAQVAALDGAVVDEPAIPFTLRDMDGRERSLDEFRGKVVFLNFWATWCPPCIEEMPSMLALSQSLRDRPFVMVAVSADDDGEEDALRSFLREAGFGPEDAVILRDPSLSVARSYGTRLLPETYLIDGRGHIVGRFMGAKDWQGEAAHRLIERLFRAPWGRA